MPRADHVLQLQWCHVASVTAACIHVCEASSSASTRPTVSLGRLRGADGLYGHSVLRAPAPSLTCFWAALLVLHGAAEPEPAAAPAGSGGA